MDKNNRKGVQWLNWRLLLFPFLVSLIEGFNITGFLSLLPFLREEFALTLVETGLYSTFSLITATMISVYSGRIVDGLGAKRGMVLGVISLGLLMSLHSPAPAFQLILILALMLGLGCSLLIPAVNKVVLERVPLKNRALAMGIVSSAYGIGGLLGAGLLPLWAEAMGWRMTVLLLGFLTVVIGVMVHFLFHEKEDPEKETESQKSSLPSFKENILSMLKNRRLLWICALSSSFGMIAGAVPPHFAIFMHQDLNVSRVMAGLGFSSLQTGALLSGIVWGLISDRFFAGNRRKSLFMSGFSSSLMLLIFAFLVYIFQLPLRFIFPLSFLLGFSLWGWWALCFVMVGELTEEKFSGLATGFILVFIRLGMGISPPVFGFIADLRGSYDYSWVIFGITGIAFTTIFYLLATFDDKRQTI